MNQKGLVWKITSYDEYRKDWPSIAGPFVNLADYQKVQGYKNPEDFFYKQAYAVQTIANSRVGNILDQIFITTEFIEPIRRHLKKFTYQALDYLRMSEMAISEKERLTNIFIIEEDKNAPSQFGPEEIERFVGPMAWRSWQQANIQELYISWTVKSWQLT